jgi:dTDP-4-amino-4,6-dideoxygalactose transaminase
MSYIATANSIKYAGANPVFAEVNAEYNLDPADVEKRITANTKAILLVHQMGMPADIDAFKSLCTRHNLVLIEDAACAIGSAYKGKKIGSHSGLVCFSFHPRKVITTGDGGMITTSDPDLYQRLRILRQHGMSINDRERHLSSKVLFEEHIEVGYNYRMTDIQAAVGIKQLEKLDWLIGERRKIAQQYLSAFRDIPSFRLPMENPDYFTNYQSFSIYLTPECPVGRNELMEKMLGREISTRRGIMLAHTEKAYTGLGYHVELPVSEDLNRNSILLPLYVPMAQQDIDKIIKTVLELIAG